MPNETDLFRKAVDHWWTSKKSAHTKKAQGGTRDDNLHGKTMVGFAQCIGDFLADLGVRREHIFSGGHLTKTPSILPSYFRPSKNWDLIVVGNSRFHAASGDSGDGPMLYAAIEFNRFLPMA